MINVFELIEWFCVIAFVLIYLMNLWKCIYYREYKSAIAMLLFALPFIVCLLLGI